MYSVNSEVAAIRNELYESKLLSAKLLIQNIIVTSASPVSLDNVEFKVYSQWGEDGIIQYLIRRAAIPKELQIFVEFGVEAYLEANTRFLLMNDNWKGLIIDGSNDNIEMVRNSELYWRFDLTAMSAFIDAENINRLIADAGFMGEIGLLSIDIDGNDYWIWERISVVDPIIVIIEYNSIFGPTLALTVPYDPKFNRTTSHHSNLYCGCSLKALELLGRRKGYALVGSNSAGNNAFFVRADRLNGQPQLTSEEAYVESRFRESRNRDGRLTYLSGAARLREISEMPVLDLERNALRRIDDLIS
jgi:hypothetical protein